MLQVLALVLAVDAGVDSAVLEKAFLDDQGDRMTQPIDWGVVNRRDGERRRLVQRELDEKRVRTSLDYYRAAMVFQHGQDVEDARRARDLATKSVELDGNNQKAKWLVAAATDRWLMRQDKPQRYGTQFVKEDGGWVLHPVDETVSDADRAAWNVPSLAEARRRVETMNAPPPQPDAGVPGQRR